MTPDWRHRRLVELGLKARNDNPSGAHGRHFLATSSSVCASLISDRHSRRSSCLDDFLHSFASLVIEAIGKLFESQPRDGLTVIFHGIAFHMQARLVKSW
jgi:hypothetical protein